MLTWFSSKCFCPLTCLSQFWRRKKLYFLQLLRHSSDSGHTTHCHWSESKITVMHVGLKFLQGTAYIVWTQLQTLQWTEVSPTIPLQQYYISQLHSLSTCLVIQSRGYTSSWIITHYFDFILAQSKPGKCIRQASCFTPFSHLTGPGHFFTDLSLSPIHTVTHTRARNSPNFSLVE